MDLGRESPSDVKDRERSPEQREERSPPIRTSEESRNQGPKQIVKRSNSSNSQLPGRKPLLPRKESLLSLRYDHIQSKVDSKLEERFIPGASQVRLPTYSRRSTYTGGGQQSYREIWENQSPRADAEDEGKEEQASYNHREQRGSPASSAKASPSYSDRVRDYFDGTHGSSEPTTSPYSEAGSPSHRSKSDTQSITNSDVDSKSSSRKGSFGHPTSNPADYAVATDSFKRKVYERRDHDMTMNLRTEANMPAIQRKKTMERDAPTLLTDALDQLGKEKIVRFEESETPVTARKGRPHRRTISEGQVLTLGLSPYEHLRESGSDHSFAQKDHEDEFDVGEAEDYEHQDISERQEKDDKGVKKALSGAMKQNEKNQAIIQQQEEVIRKLEFELQATVEQGKLEHATSLQERDKTIEQQSYRIKELEGSIQSMEEEEVSYTAKIAQLEEAVKRNLEIQQTKNLEDVERKQNDHLDHEKERALQQALQENEALAQQIVQLEEALQQKRVEDAIATGTDTPSWQEDYLRKARINTAQEMEINHLKESVRKLDAYNPVLEREVKELRAYVTAHRDTVESLQDQLENSRSAAQEWKHEYEQQKDMLDQRTFTEQTELDALREEMQRTIAQYQALLPSKDHPDALEITGVLKKIDALQETLKQTTARLENLKKEKATLEQELLAITQENRDLSQANEVLKYGPPPLPRAIIDQESHEVLALPEWNFEELALKREAAVAEFRRKQKAAREAREAEEKLMEKVREAKLGEWHPPKRRHFAELAQKSRWERWEGRRWIDEQSSPEEYDMAKRLGLLEERRRKWRTEDWKGKGLSDMAFRNRNEAPSRS